MQTTAVVDACRVSLEFTAQARQVLGPDKLLTTGLFVVTDKGRDRARAIARETVRAGPGRPFYAGRRRRSRHPHAAAGRRLRNRHRPVRTARPGAQANRVAEVKAVVLE